MWVRLASSFTVKLTLKVTTPRNRITQLSNLARQIRQGLALLAWLI